MQRRKIRLTVQYDGYDYHGWQIQPGKRTVQGLLSEAVSDLVGHKITVHAASRTDAGVSALGQAAVFEVISPIPTENFKDAINDRLPPDIVVCSCDEAGRDFDVMGGVASKLYRYTICTQRRRPVLEVRRCWHIPRRLDVAAMDKAAGLLVGRRDFKSFAAGKDRRESSVRTIFRCGVSSSSEGKTQGQSDRSRYVYVDVEGDGFLYNMVRNVVGTLVEAGLGRMTPEKITEILEAKDRTAAGPIAPPQGLCLMWVKYREAGDRREELEDACDVR
ncbi:MAG: tRNA pseudouridine(38-40) synthase TruA [Phycisphaerales bacterium]|nr:MAG: tRNA pseudouridine(38-40) synthase TruA [Phycisphaerales bacterium]